MNLKFLEKLKKLTIIAMVSDDYLMEKLVLKGGNALDLFYGISPRASLDLDFPTIALILRLLYVKKIYKARLLRLAIM